MRESKIIYYLGLELLLLGLGLGKGLGVGVGVGLDTYKTIFMKVSSAPVAQWLAGWTLKPEVDGSTPTWSKFFLYIIEEHPQIMVTLKISELKLQVPLRFSGKST